MILPFTINIRKQKVAYYYLVFKGERPRIKVFDSIYKAKEYLRTEISEEYENEIYDTREILAYIESLLPEHQNYKYIDIVKDSSSDLLSGQLFIHNIEDSKRIRRIATITPDLKVKEV